MLHNVKIATANQEYSEFDVLFRKCCVPSGPDGMPKNEKGGHAEKYMMTKRGAEDGAFLQIKEFEDIAALWWHRCSTGGR